MEIRKIRQIAKILKSEGLEELELQDGDSYLRLKRSVSGQPVVLSEIDPKRQETEDGVKAEKTIEPEGKLILSPLAGTFYRAKAPGAPPFINVGDTVQKGQTLCILEAMKLMNELESEFSGTVTEIFVDDAEPINEGQPLIRILPE